MKKNDGFTLIEVLIAATLLLTVVTTIVPIISLVQSERQVLSERRTLSLKVHDELQQFLWLEDITLPAGYTNTIHGREVQLTFKEENDYVKGCAKWQNAKKRNESFCLYGIPKQ